MVVSISGNASFSDNSAQENGGAIMIVSPGEVSVAGASFTSNKAIFGGALFVDSMNVNATFDDLLLEDNVATASGGAFYWDAGDEWERHEFVDTDKGGSELLNSTFRRNYAGEGFPRAEYRKQDNCGDSVGVRQLNMKVLAKIMC